ncbi:D-alanyl-D-alanine carboxypeptidase [Streptomyces nanshensis]|uniref:D-alanyl-D-alanine carboxypeptidase n=1 Tax=Streptomyces nanshensis TaxID=518642 RepID=UPI001FD0294E|nr:serine hydrolase [Streptomyces nanshensis]
MDTPGGTEESDAGTATEGAESTEGGGPNDARLKAAVAAWVAGSDDERDEPRQADAETADTGNGEAVKDGTANSAAREKNSSQIPASDLPVRPKPEGGDESDADGDGGEAAADAGGESAGEGTEDAEAEPQRASGVTADTGASRATEGAESAVRGAGEVDNPTAMFRTVRVDADDTAATDSEEAARRAERMTAAFFGASKKSDGEGGEEEDADTASSAGEGEGEEPSGTEGAVPAAATDEPMPAAPDASNAPDEPAVPAARETPKSESKSASEPKSEPEPEAEKSVDGVDGAAAKGAESSAETSEDEDEGEPAGERVDEPTTAIRAFGPDAPAKGSAKKRGTDRVDQPTAVFRTVDPPTRDAGDDKADPKAGEKPDGDADTDADAKPAKPVDPRLPAESAKSAAAAKSADSGASASGKPKAEQTAPAAESEAPAKPDGKPDAKPDAEPEAEPDAGAEPPESESERTSQFVPLRSADAPPRPKHDPAPVVPPKPEGPPTAGELPPEAAPERQLSEAELTRQQARPDQAPLDLLAQLTNTPPPPETPLRNAVRRVKIWTPLVVVLAILFVIAQAVRPLPDPELSLSAAPTYTFQGAKPSMPWPSEGQAAVDVQGLGSLGSYGKQKPVPIASVAKVMTAYVILRDHPVKKGSQGAKIPVDKKAEDEAGLSAQNESTVEVKKGDTLTEKEAVEAVMIASANNVARLLARWDAGSEKAFAKKMNAAAKDLGMKNTKYTDPSGLTASTVSTATDQVRLAKKAMNIDLFRDTVRLPSYKDAEGEEHGNWNKLVPVDGVVGIKTGTTTKAGGNLLFAAEQRVGGTEQLVVGAVLGQYQPSILDTVLAKSKKLIDTAQDSLRAQKVVEKGEVVGYVDDQLGGRTPVVASRDVSAVGWSGLKVKLGLTDGGKALPHTGKAGDRAGTLTVGDGPGQVRVPVKLKDDMSEPGFGAKLTRIL